MNSELIQKEKDAIKRLQAFEPIGDSYYLCYSGGKDSDAIRILAQLAGVLHEIHHNLTTVDAPETIAYIKTIPNVMIDKAVTYIADFVYTTCEPHPNGGVRINKRISKEVVEDVKGMRTPVYIIKRKLFRWRYPDYVFREV